MKTEQQVQSALIKQLEADNWYVIKVIKCSKNGCPDVIALKSNEVWLIEVKRKGGKLSKLQEFRIKELNSKGIKATVHYGE